MLPCTPLRNGHRSLHLIRQRQVTDTLNVSLEQNAADWASAAVRSSDNALQCYTSATSNVRLFRQLCRSGVNVVHTPQNQGANNQFQQFLHAHMQRCSMPTN
jgi:hypothetical protein